MSKNCLDCIVCNRLGLQGEDWDEFVCGECVRFSMWRGPLVGLYLVRNMSPSNEDQCKISIIAANNEQKAVDEVNRQLDQYDETVVEQIGFTHDHVNGEILWSGDTLQKPLVVDQDFHNSDIPLGDIVATAEYEAKFRRQDCISSGRFRWGGDQ